MAVARTHHNKNYTCMSNYHFQDRNLSLKAKGLLSLMLSLPEEWDYSVAGLASLSSDGETSVRSAVKELEQSNYLKRTPVRSGGRIVDWEYDIYEKPIEILDVENQQVEKLTIDFKDNKVNKQLSKKEENKNNKKILGNSGNFDFGPNKTQPKASLYTNCVSLVYSFTNNLAIQDLLIRYLNMRLEIREKPLYLNMWKGMLSKLNTLAAGNKDLMIDIIQQSIDRGYLSFYAVSNTAKPRDVFCEGDGLCNDTYTKEELEEIKRQADERERNGKRGYF